MKVAVDMIVKNPKLTKSIVQLYSEEIIESKYRRLASDAGDEFVREFQGFFTDGLNLRLENISFKRWFKDKDGLRVGIILNIKDAKYLYSFDLTWFFYEDDKSEIAGGVQFPAEYIKERSIKISSSDSKEIARVLMEFVIKCFLSYYQIEIQRFEEIKKRVDIAAVKETEKLKRQINELTTLRIDKKEK